MKKVIQAITNRIDVKEIANVVVKSIDDNFNKGLNADGSKMRPLAKQTIEIKKKRGGIAPTKPLIFKGGSKKGVKSIRINQKEAQVVSTGMAKNYFEGSRDISSVDMFKYQEKQDRKPFGINEKVIQDVIKLVKKQLGR